MRQQRCIHDVVQLRPIVDAVRIDRHTGFDRLQKDREIRDPVGRIRVRGIEQIKRRNGVRNELPLRQARIVFVLAANYARGGRSGQPESLRDNARRAHARIADAGGDPGDARVPVARDRLFDQRKNIEMRDIRRRMLDQELIEVVAAKIIEHDFAAEPLRKRRQVTIFAPGRAKDKYFLRCGKH